MILETDTFVHKDFIKQEFEFSQVYSYIDKYKTADLYTMQCDCSNNTGVRINQTIWMMWMQGMEYAPELVKKCYSSICTNKPLSFDIILLTRKNIWEYIQLPEYILEKYHRGIITETHLSDIIRIELLSRYGGCWIDATVFCGGKIPEYMLSDMFFFKLESILTNPVIKMSSWWLAADSQNRIIHATRHMMQSYWEYESKLRNYFLLHIIMSKIIDEDQECQDIFRNIPFFGSRNAQTMVGKLNARYDKKDWLIMRDSCFIQKLTYKTKCIRGDIYNFYTALLEGKLD